MWWNTSLSPPAPTSNRTSNDREFVVEHLKELRALYGFDLVGLCEVSTEDLDSILDGLGDCNLEVFDETDHKSRLKIDTAIIYDRRKLVKIDSKHFIDRFGNDTLKAGTLVTFAEPISGQLLHVVISHWPGRQSAPELSAKRDKLGQYLWTSLREVKKAGQGSHVLLMGDYNDDPFAESLASHLLATRDRGLAQKNDDFYYNPFWTRMGESIPILAAEQEQSVCGTHFYRSGSYSRWFTFDQMIFSSSFLQEDSPVILDEIQSQIVVTAELKQNLLSGSSVFDHFPVRSVVKLRTPK